MKKPTFRNNNISSLILERNKGKYHLRNHTYLKVKYAQSNKWYNSSDNEFGQIVVIENVVIVHS